VTEALIVVTTTETQADAERLAQILVEQELAACVQVMPQIISIYRWKEKIEQASETLLFIKTTRDVYPELEAAIKQHHSYQTPEILAIPAANGSADYLNWLNSSIKVQR